MNDNDMLKYDVRVRARMLKKGDLREADLERYLSALPDVEQNAARLELSQPALTRPEPKPAPPEPAPIRSDLRPGEPLPAPSFTARFAESEPPPAPPANPFAERPEPRLFQHEPPSPKVSAPEPSPAGGFGGFSSEPSSNPSPAYQTPRAPTSNPLSPPAEAPAFRSPLAGAAASPPAAPPPAAEPVAAEPVAAEPVAVEPVAAEPPAAQPPVAEPPAAAPVAAPPAPSDSIWDPPPITPPAPRVESEQAEPAEGDPERANPVSNIPETDKTDDEWG